MKIRAKKLPCWQKRARARKRCSPFCTRFSHFGTAAAFFPFLSPPNCISFGDNGFVPTAVAHARPPTAVLIADSTRMGSQLLAEALRRERRFRIIGCAAGGDDLLFLLARSPDVVVLAANLERPGGGLHTAARIAAQGCRAAIVILLDEPCEGDLVVQAFRAGARGVFSRSLSLPEMGKCIECVAAGQVWASAEHMDYLLAALRRAVVPRFSDAAAGLLSRREQEVVRYMCDGLTNRDIARTLGLSEHTVKNHLFRIYAKLGVEKRAEVIFSLLSRAPAAEPPQSLPNELLGNLPAQTLPATQQGSRSFLAQCLLDNTCPQGASESKDPFSAYTWLLRSEKGAVELLHKCRAIREMLGSHLTAEQRKQAELRAAQPWPNRSPVRLNRLAPAAGLPLPLPERHNS